MKQTMLWASAAAICASLIGIALWARSVPTALPNAEEPPVGSPLTASLPVEEALTEAMDVSLASPAATRKLIEQLQHGALLLEVYFADDTPAADVGLTLGWPEDEARPVVQGRTNLHGTLLLEGLSLGEVRIGFDRSREQRRAAVHAGRETTTRIVLPRGLDLVGDVRDSQGQPVPGASVWVEPNDLASAPILLARCDVEGSFVASGVDTALRIWARAPLELMATLEPSPR